MLLCGEYSFYHFDHDLWTLSHSLSDNYAEYLQDDTYNTNCIKELNIFQGLLVTEQLNTLNKLINWQVWPFTIALWASALITTNLQGYASWLGFGWQLMQLLIVMFPVLLFKAASQNVTSTLRISGWCLVFAAYPVLLFVLQNTLPDMAVLTAIKVETFVFIWIIEALLLSNNWLRGRQKKRLKINITLDHSLLAFTVILSLFWAAVFTPYNEPMATTIDGLYIDLPYVFSHLFTFLSYFLQILITYSIVFIYYIINRHLLVNRVMANHGIFHYLWLMLIFVLLSYPVAAQIILWLPMNSAEHTMIVSENNNPLDWENASFALAVMLMSLPVILALEWANKNQQLAELEKQNIQTELLWLQQQINPHFLFNTLNNLYALCLTNSKRAPKFVQQLSNLLRFVVYRGGQNKVQLTEEIQYLQDYLDLQQVRVSNKCVFEVELSPRLGAGHNMMIAPLLLVILLENAFKHGIEPSTKDAWLNVKLSVEADTLTFSCSNSINEAYNPSDVGIGLSNLQRRLALIYPNKHQLNIEQQSNCYRVDLTLECQ